MSSDDDGPRTATGCAPCNANVRNNYFRGKMMTVADYQAEQRYMIERRRVVNRLLLGWGIISGFDVELRQGGAIAVGTGSALDPCGREVIACHDVVIKEEDDVVWLKEGKCGLEPTDPPTVPPAEPPAPADAAGYGSDSHGTDGQPVGQEEYQDEPGPAGPQGSPTAENGELCYLLSAHYAERHVDGVRVSNGCDDSACATNRICETVVYSLRPPGGKGSPLPATGDCEDLEPAEGQEPAPLPTEPPLIAPVDNRGLAGLCLHDPDEWCDRTFDPCCLPKLSRKGDLELDFDAGIALAYVCFRRGRCGELVFTGIHEIIRGCALTRIKDIGWPNWHRDPDIVIGPASFFAMFADPGAPSGGGSGAGASYPAVDTRFWVCFTGPVQIASLTRDVISISLIQSDSREAVDAVVRVPIDSVWCKPTLPFDPPGTTRGFRPRVTHQFWQGEVGGGTRSGFANETLVELRIRCGAIIDGAGRAVDGDSIGNLLPSGNGTPGGEFLSSWRVAPNGPDSPPRGPAGP